MKKSTIFRLLLVFGFAAALGLTSTTASASSWHKGTPSFLIHKYYRTSIKHGYAGVPQFNYVYGSKKSFIYKVAQADGSGGSASYKKSGSTYTIRTKNAWGSQYFTIKKLSSTKFKVKTGSSRYETMTRFYHFPKYKGSAVR
ncbi:hypothetical protein HC026_07990 [Lactobacillus sp. LC28-10]|uniref:Uncharacterized protein n=1 Tax=Secundilactobacillus angelensis TaxID=2722706 RepID=A0ABX1L1B8_9LACO|nr:hypothetical protein [Secundilactobacillus angelensis]MCH5463056.1 hypothetical protein [Secundilactobacillus angelensis]NLR18863.1 hypothetical protein [Secundilactobacillus angelensis]